MARQEEDEAHLPKPKTLGEVIEAPYYVRVRPGWLEKWLFVAVLIQIMLGLLFLIHGSRPARELGDEVEVNRVVVCNLLRQTSPLDYEHAVSIGYCSTTAPIGTRA